MSQALKLKTLLTLDLESKMFMLLTMIMPTRRIFNVFKGVNDDACLWHTRLGQVSMHPIDKLCNYDLLRGSQE